MFFVLLFLLFASSLSLRIAYLDGDVRPRSTILTGRLRQSGISTAADRKDINPKLFGSIRGLAGLEIRINPRGFSYAGLLLGPIISDEIKRTRLSPSRECIQQLNGCITLYNLFVSRYRCPQLVSVYPAPPNRLVVTVRNLDFEITGNLGGEIEVILPITLTGIVHISAHQVSVTTQLTMHRASDGSPYVRVIGCYVSIGFTDVVVQNGGLVGDVFNSQFRGTSAEQARRALPVKMCGVISDVIRKKLNSRFQTVPQWVPLSKFASIAEGIISSISVSNLPEHCHTPLCEHRIQSRDAITHLSAPSVAQNPEALRRIVQRHDVQRFAGDENSLTDPVPWGTRTSSNEMHLQPLRTVSATVIASKRSSAGAVIRTVRGVGAEGAVPRAHQLPRKLSGQWFPTTTVLRRVTLPPSSSAPRISAHSATSAKSLDPCADCYPNNESNPVDAFSTFRKSVDIKKLADLMLSLYLLKTSATPNDFTIALSGEFSPKGRGGTPFHPFPMQFPRTRSSGNRMVEVLVSDYTVNSLFYYMHKRDFITLRIGPDTPKLGPLLKTTCSDNDYYDLDDSGVDDDEEKDEGAKSTVFSSKSRKRRRRKAADEEDDEREGSLEDLGVCLGDIMPAVRDKYPKKLLHIKIHSSRAPSVLLSARRGGVATISMAVNAEMYIDDSGEKVGTIAISIVLDVSILASGNRIVGVVDIQSLNLTDKQQTLGLPQDALDNLANLSKGVISKMANDALTKGFVVQLPTAKLLFTVLQPKLSIVEHAIHLASDFKVSATAFGITSSSICRRF